MDKIEIRYIFFVNGSSYYTVYFWHNKNTYFSVHKCWIEPKLINICNELPQKDSKLTELQTDLNPFNVLKRTQISVGQNMMNPSANPEKPYWNPSKILNFKPYELGLTQH